MKRKHEEVNKTYKKIKISYNKRKYIYKIKKTNEDVTKKLKISNKRKYIYNLKYNIKKHKYTLDLCFIHNEKYICDIYECDGKIKNNFYHMPYNN